MCGNKPNRPNSSHLEEGEEDIPDEVWEIMQRCWAEDSHDRPTAGEVLRFLRHFDISSQLHEGAFEGGADDEDDGNSSDHTVVPLRPHAGFDGPCPWGRKSSSTKSKFTHPIITGQFRSVIHMFFPARRKANCVGT
jgi:hypothetical protein